MRVVAVIVLVLGLVSIESGLVLAGSPYAVSNLARATGVFGVQDDAAGDAALAAGNTGRTSDPDPAAGAGSAAAAGSAAGASHTADAVRPIEGSTLAGTLGVPIAPVSTNTNVYRITVGDQGYSPTTIHAQPNTPIQLALVTSKTYSCARAFVIPSLGVEKILPATGITTIDVPAQKPGSKLFFSCSMGMYSGVIVSDE